MFPYMRIDGIPEDVCLMKPSKVNEKHWQHSLKKVSAVPSSLKKRQTIPKDVRF